MKKMIITEVEVLGPVDGTLFYMYVRFPGNQRIHIVPSSVLVDKEKLRYGLPSYGLNYFATGNVVGWTVWNQPSAGHIKALILDPPEAPAPEDDPEEDEWEEWTDDTLRQLKRASDLKSLILTLEDIFSDMPTPRCTCGMVEDTEPEGDKWKRAILKNINQVEPGLLRDILTDIVITLTGRIGKGE